MTATKRRTPKRQDAGTSLIHATGASSLNRLAQHAGAVWIMTTLDDNWIVRARSNRGEEWAARGR